MHSRVWLLGCLLSASCNTPGRVPTIRADEAAVTPTSTASPTVAPQPSVAAECKTDKDCAWDDPCFAKKCLPHPKEFVGCDKSMLPPGICGCDDGRCTIRPHDP
jgi:hypothetical protein